jgi:hypothetical protein
MSCCDGSTLKVVGGYSPDDVPQFSHVELVPKGREHQLQDLEYTFPPDNGEKLVYRSADNPRQRGHRSMSANMACLISTAIIVTLRTLACSTRCGASAPCGSAAARWTGPPEHIVDQDAMQPSECRELSATGLRFRMCGLPAAAIYTNEKAAVTPKGMTAARELQYVVCRLPRDGNAGGSVAKQCSAQAAPGAQAESTSAFSVAARIRRLWRRSTDSATRPDRSDSPEDGGRPSLQA